MENNYMGLAELEELEAFEIDAALLRDLLEEEREDDDGGVKQWEEVDKDKSMMIDKKKEEKQQQQSWLEHNEWHVHDHDFEWLNMMEMEMEMKPLSPNEAMVNWYPDDIVGMVDFGYTDCQHDYSQICDLLVSNETSYGCLWENL